MLATLAGGSLALATDFARQALSALVECSFRGSAFPTFPDVEWVVLEDWELLLEVSLRHFTKDIC